MGFMDDLDGKSRVSGCALPLQRSLDLPGRGCRNGKDRLRCQPAHIYNQHSGLMSSYSLGRPHRDPSPHNPIRGKTSRRWCRWRRELAQRLANYEQRLKTRSLRVGTRSAMRVQALLEFTGELASVKV
jgi:hypothetical protein